MFTISQGLFLFMPYIVSTIIKGHTDAANVLAAKLKSTCLSIYYWRVYWLLLLKKIKRIRMPLSYFSLFLILLGALYTGYLVKNSFYLTCVGFLFAVASWLYIQRHHNDPYGLFHLSLNKLPFEDPNSLPETEWLNLGYWKVFSIRISILFPPIIQRFWIGRKDISRSV